MTTQTLQPATTHISTRTLAMAGAGALLAVAAGFGVYALVDDAPATSETTTSFIPGTSGDLYDGTNREARALMHRR
jgi:hypothetical protein